MTFTEAKNILNGYAGRQYAKGDSAGYDDMKGCWDFISDKIVSLLPEGITCCRKNYWQNSGTFARYYWMRTTAESHKDDLKKDGKKYSNAPISLSFFIEKGNEDSYNFRICLEIEHDGATIPFLRKYYSFFDLDENSRQGLSLFNENSDNYLANESLNDYQAVEQAVNEKLDADQQTFFSIGLSFPIGENEEENERKISDAFSRVKVVYDYVINRDQGLIPSTGDDTSDEDICPPETKKFPKNIILFGAPGTGKTYATTNYAVTICKKDYDLEKTKKAKREDVNKDFDDCRKKGQIDFITFHQSYSYEDFVVGLFPRLNASGGLSYEVRPGAFLRICRKARADAKNNYVLIIDEINRGNISKIFGELITLIEESRREGASEQSNALLPYSTKPDGSPEYFSVPSNLYIIGTMNTADRSIQHIDTALRRRFAFVEMKPDVSLFKNVVIRHGGGKLELDKMLTGLNNRIEAYFDREHVIGQSYFTPLLGKMSDDERFALLGEIFANQIIPLLQDYFFDDYRKICLVLGEDPDDDDDSDFVQVAPESDSLDDQAHPIYKVCSLDEKDSPFKKLDGYLKIVGCNSDVDDE